MCVRQGGNWDIAELEFDSANEIHNWVRDHSYRDIISKNEMLWCVDYVYDNELRENVTDKFAI